MATNTKYLHRALTFFIGFVWMANGLWAKVLRGVPRHEEIVASILGDTYARELTILIGLAEIATAIWIIFDRYRKLTAVAQISIILLMNILETLLARDLLLWGPYNLLFAILFCGVVYLHGFKFNGHDEHA